MRISLGLLSALPALASACVAPPSASDPLAVAAWPIVYGDDGRIESYELTDARLERIAQSNTLAIMTDAQLSIGTRRVGIDAPNLGEVAQLCSDERFVEQPSAAVCTGLLIDAQTVVTADHCARGLGCDQMRFVRGYFYESEGVLHALRPADVYHCQAVVAHKLSATAAAERVDYAVIELDRPIEGRVQAITWRKDAEPLEEGEALTLVGFPSGVPLKIEQGGVVTNGRASTLDYFISNLDAFHGDSGSPVFDAELRLVGIEGRGHDDYAASDDCSAVVRASDDPSAALEQATYAFHARDAYCDARPQSALCCEDGKACSAESEPAGGCSISCRSRHRCGGAAYLLLLAAVAAGARRRTLVQSRKRSDLASQG